MALNVGTRLGVYQVTAKIGEGGMGEVYQARDTKLDRDVALKALPEAFTWNGRRGRVSPMSRAVSQVSNGKNHGVILCRQQDVSPLPSGGCS